MSSILLTLAVGIAYFLAARLSLALLTKPDGVAVFWPAAGVSAGVLIALGPGARLPVAAGAIAATIVANLLGDRTVWSAIVFALCNAAEAVLTAGMIEFLFGTSFTLDRLRNVLGLFAAAIVGAGISGIGGTAGYVLFHSSTAPALTIWHHWFTSDALGIITLAPLLIGLNAAMRNHPLRRELIEGAGALVTLTVMSGLVIFLPREPWASVVAIAAVFPLLLWLAARCRPVFSAAASFIVALTVVWTTTFGIGVFGDSDFPIADRILAAQAGMVAVSLCSLVLAALFSERRQHQAALKESEARTPELRLLYETAPIGLAFLTPDCRYLQINRHLTEICGISVADHIGRSVRETVPQVAEQVENIVRAILRTGEAITGIEINGQRPDGRNAERMWNTYWHPLKAPNGEILGINVVAEEITERKRAEAALAASEARFRELANNISQFAWTADSNGWIYWYNKRWHDYTGTKLEDMEGWGWQKVHHPDHVERVVQRIRESFESGTPWEDTFPLRGVDGSYRWFLSRALPIRNEAGEVVRWFGTNTDITKQIEAEKALRELNETLEQRVEDETRERLQIWNVSQDLLVVADLEGRYLSVNPAWTPTLGWSNSELLGRTSRWLLHPDDHDKTYDEIGRLGDGRKTLRFESRFRHKDGSYRWISWDAAPDGGRIYAMGRDVTELKDAENLLRETRGELAQFARRTMLTTMTASIAHEINQPLAAMAANGNAGLRWLTRTEPDLDEVRHALERVVENSNRAGDIVASIRAMFRKDGQKKEPLNVNDLVRDVFALVRDELERRRIVLQSELRDDLPKIVGERVPLQQVLLNLIRNAVEAMSSVTDRKPLLSVKTQMYELHDVVITVADSGTGIDQKDMNRIFEAFFTTKPEGMGMGLSICRSIVEGHGGRLWVTPGAPQGSVFHVQLPMGAGEPSGTGRN